MRPLRPSRIDHVTVQTLYAALNCCSPAGAEDLWGSTLRLHVPPSRYKQVGKAEASPQDPSCQVCWTLVPLRHILIRAGLFVLATLTLASGLPCSDLKEVHFKIQSIWGQRRELEPLGFFRQPQRRDRPTGSTVQLSSEVLFCRQGQPQRVAGRAGTASKDRQGCSEVFHGHLNGFHSTLGNPSLHSLV